MSARFLAACFAILIPLTATAAEPALGGNCAVCLVESGNLVPGSDQHTVVFDRQVYAFPTAREKAMFLANPARYAPALGGDCVVCLVNRGVRMPGKPEFAVVHDKRAYLFPSAKERDAFKADPKRYAAADLGLGGYCSVCVVMARKWVAGKSEFVSVYDGVRYLFPGADEKAAFDADPAKFTPALEGACVVCLKDAQKRVVGSSSFSVIHDGRIYLFPDAATQRQFLAHPDQYARVDFANGGQCVVCARMSKQAMPGKVEFASVYKARRYLFPSAKEKQMFDADPTAFVVSDRKPDPTPAEVRVIGKTACAGCSYGVQPIRDADSMGIAVVSGGLVYVVEGGEKAYPELFQARFDGVAVELKGIVKKSEGRYVWVEPSSLTVSR